ncbi:MAG: hypothetical protein RBT59_04840 [Arcobacteraceae bacterium]|jgi:hypothetical protein|nr:hypothetical protein [Arcobacteraceae bacterium]
MLEYLKRLFKKWYAYLPIVPDLIDTIQSHLEYTIPISSIILNGFALIALLYATYEVWNDMRLEKLELEEKLKNPIDYEVKAKIKKVKIDLDYIEKSINENIEKTESLINSASQELENLSSNDDIDPKIMQILNDARQYLSSGNHSQSEIIYRSNLRSYIESLKSYPDKKDSFISEWKFFSNNEIKDVYFVDFTITNTGRRFDEDIDIEIHFNNGNRYICEVDLLDNFPFNLNLPFKPKKDNNMESFMNSIQREHDVYELDRLRRNSNPLTYKRYEEIRENFFSIKIRDLKVLDTISIFKNNGYFIKISDINDIDVVISSKHTTSKINKKLVLENCEEFDYFKEKNGKNT